MDRRPSHRFTLLSMLLALGLGACSGSSNSPAPTPPVPALQVADDAFPTLTGRDQLLDVLANDRDPAGGALTLVAVSGQGQAALTIDGNRVRYRPRCCDLVADEFRYTVRAAGGATATAVVRVTVERRVMLRGMVADLGPNYTLRLFDGANGGEARRETTPEFVLDLLFSNATSLLRLEARRLDASGAPSAREVLQSALGDLPQLAQEAGSDGELGADEAEALRVSSLSTAWLGRLREANGGALPLDSARWNALRAEPVDVEDVLTRAQLVKAALDDAALVLPVPDTFALASSAVQSTALLAAQFSDFTTRDRAALFGPASRRALPAPPPTLWLYRGGFAQDEVALKLELASGGTGRAIGAYAPVPITWTFADGALRVQGSGIPLIFGSVVLAGSVCNGISPVTRIDDRNLIVRFDVRGLALRPASAFPADTVVDYEGLAVTGGSFSSCARLFSPLSLRSGLGLIASDQPRGVTLPEGPLGGAWVLPRCPRCNIPDARPLRAGRVSLDANRQGRGLFEEDAGVINARVEGGVVRLTSVAGEAKLYPVAGAEGAYRVVAEFPTADGAGAVSEGWLVQEDASLRLADLWQGRTLRDCCRQGELRGLVLGADGEFAGAGVNISTARFELDGRRVVLEQIQSESRPAARFSFTALRRLPDGRVLLLTRFDDDLQTEIDDELPSVDIVRFE